MDDRDNDGFVSFDEFSGPKGLGTKSDVFFEGDTNADGFITLDEALVLKDPAPM